VLWRSRRERAAETSPRREVVGAAEPQPPCYRSPTLKALLSRLSPDTLHHILDLGGVHSANVEFFSHYSCRLQIVNLLDALTSEASRALLASDPARAFRQVLPQTRREFDVVLVWDVLNHLDKEKIRALTSILADLTAPGAQMLAFLFTAKEISALPLAFKIIDEETLLYEPQTQAVRPGPRYPPAEVERMEAGFAVVRSVLMRHGVQEYLFARRRDE
jgi:hypothetical protein